MVFAAATSTSGVGSQDDVFDNGNGSPFSDQQANSFRPTGISIAIALLALVIIFISFVAVMVFLRRRKLMRKTNKGMQAPRSTMHYNSAFPLTGSRDHILAAHLSLDIPKSTSTDTKEPDLFALSDKDLEAGDMPLPPPPSYQETTSMAPIKSISGSSWVTEASVAEHQIEQPAPARKGPGERSVLRFAVRSGAH